LEEGVVSTVEAETRSVFRELAQRQESEIIEGRLMPDHVHMLISIPPKHSVSSLTGFIKGKSANHIARGCLLDEAQLCGTAFLGARVLGIDVGKNEAAVRRYIQEQEKKTSGGQMGLMPL